MTPENAADAAHLAQFVSGLRLHSVRADFHVCGTPKPLADSVFITQITMVKFQAP